MINNIKEIEKRALADDFEIIYNGSDGYGGDQLALIDKNNIVIVMYIDYSYTVLMPLRAVNCNEIKDILKTGKHPWKREGYIAWESHCDIRYTTLVNELYALWDIKE